MEVKGKWKVKKGRFDERVGKKVHTGTRGDHRSLTHAMWAVVMVVAVVVVVATAAMEQVCRTDSAQPAATEQPHGNGVVP